ncbi:MAG: hypothetical protein CMF57_08955 [Leifsonia sp.]|nr:hypothetical protein [Leifsonia sp.]
MIVDRSQPTLAEIAEQSTEGKVELAAARAELQASTLLSQAFEARQISQKELADALGVSEGRVSQVLSGYSNARITTLARYLRALGYHLRLAAEPAESGAPALRPLRARSRTRRDRQEIDVYVVPSRDGEDAQGGVVFWPGGSSISSASFGQAQVVGRLVSGNAMVQSTTYEGRIGATR